MLPLLVRVDNLNTNTSQQYAFGKSPVRIGRNPLNDLAIDQQFVSQWHAVVQFNEQYTQFYDLGSTNGTLVNNRRLAKNEPVAIDPNLDIRVGALRLVFGRGPAPAHLLNQRPAGFLGGGGGGGGGDSEHTMIAPGGMAELGSTMLLNQEATSVFQPGVHGAGGGVGNLGQVRGQIAQLKPAYDQYRAAWNTFYQSMAALMGKMNPQMQTLAATFLQQDFPTIAGEEQFRTFAQALKVTLTGPSGMGAAAGQLVKQFVQYMVPQAPQPENGQDVEKFLMRVVTILEAFAASFVAMRKGHDQFGQEMGISVYKGEPTPLNSANEGKEVLAYLLDWNADVNSQRIQELTTQYADLMVHQVALLNGLMEGVRALLRKLGPAEIEKEVASAPIKLGPISLPRALWPFRAGARWRRFVQRHTEFVDEERALNEAVLGRDFARVYNQMMGGREPDTSPKLLR